jgi:hypothetical protein
LRPSCVIEPRWAVAKVCAAKAQRSAGRKSFADRPSSVSKLKQAETRRRLVAILVGDDGNAGGPAAGVELHSGRLNVAPDAVLQADREPVAAMDNRPAAFEMQASPLLAARHDRPLALIEDEYRQFRLLNLALTGPLPLRAISLGNVADRRLSKTQTSPHSRRTLLFKSIGRKSRCGDDLAHGATTPASPEDRRGGLRRVVSRLRSC